MTQDFFDRRHARWHAVGIHLAISALVFSVVLLVIILDWYRGPFFFTDGGLQGVRIAFFVQMVLGPMLTAFLVKPKKDKRKIRFDLYCVGVAQLIAVAAGLFVVYDQRPIAIIHHKGAFYPITPASMREQSTAPSDLKRFGLESPVMLHNEGPRVQSEFIQMMFKSAQGIEEFRQTERFRSLKHHMNQVKQNQVNIAELSAQHPGFRHALDEFLNSNTQGNPVFKYFRGRYGTAILALSSDGRLIGHLPDPAD